MVTVYQVFEFLSIDMSILLTIVLLQILYDILFVPGVGFCTVNLLIFVMKIKQTIRILGIKNCFN